MKSWENDVNVEEIVLITLVFETNILFNKTIIKKKTCKEKHGSSYKKNWNLICKLSKN